MSEIDLKALPIDHHLRNSPLAEIGARYRYAGTKAWKEVLPTYGIAKKTFNQLAPCWTDNDDWQATRTGDKT